MKDENDKHRDGELPDDPAADTVPMRVGTSRPATLALVRGEGPTLPAPNNVVAEATAIGALLWAGQYGKERLHVGMVSDLVAPEMFFSRGHRLVWSALVRAHETLAPSDATSIHAALVERNEHREAGGIDYLEKLVADAKPTSEPQLRAYAESIRNTWARRELVKVCNATEKLAKTGELSAPDAIVKAMDTLRDLDRRVVASAGLLTAGDAARALVAHLSQPRSIGMRTGFQAFDQIFGGIVGGDVTVIGARTSVGKSALALQLAEGLVDNNPDVTALYVSLEMIARDFAMRAAASRAKIDAKLIRQNQVPAGKMAELMDAAREFGAKALSFNEVMTQTIPSITALVQKSILAARRQGKALKLVVIDHLLLVKPTSEKKSRIDHIADVTRWMKGMATAYDLGVIGLSQVNRGAEGETGGRPKLHQLKYSGSIEEDADNIVLLHRKRSSMGTFVADAPAEFIAAKVRAGEPTWVPIHVEPKFVRFGGIVDQRMEAESRKWVAKGDAGQPPEWMDDGDDDPFNP